MCERKRPPVLLPRPISTLQPATRSLPHTPTTRSHNYQLHQSPPFSSKLDPHHDVRLRGQGKGRVDQGHYGYEKAASREQPSIYEELKSPPSEYKDKVYNGSSSSSIKLHPDTAAGTKTDIAAGTKTDSAVSVHKPTTATETEPPLSDATRYERVDQLLS